MLKAAVKPKKRKMFTVKINDEELARLKKMAGKYTQGNISAWMRYAALKHIPEAKELI